MQTEEQTHKTKANYFVSLREIPFFFVSLVLQKSYIVPVHKKGSHAELHNYRPVALLSIMSKVCEKVVYDQLLKHLSDHRLISDRQFGSRKGRSAADLHLLLTSRWSAALDKGLKTMILAVDIDGAFDKVWHRGCWLK